MHRFSGQRRKKRNGDDIPDSIHSSVPWIGSEISGGESIYKLVLLQELAGNTAHFFCISKVYSVGVAGDSTWLRGNWSTAIAKLCWMWWSWVSMREMQWGALATGQTQELPEIHGYNFQRAEILLWKSRRNMFSEIWVEMLTQPYPVRLVKESNPRNTKKSRLMTTGY